MRRAPHAAAIRVAVGDDAGAHELLARTPKVELDLLASPAARALRDRVPPASYSVRR